MIIDKTVKVASSGDAFVVALANVTLVVKQVTKDGFQAGQDMPAILSAAVMELVKVMGELQNVGDDAKLHTVEFIRALTLGAVDITEAALS